MSTRVLILRDPRHHHDSRGGDVILETLKTAGFDATLTEDVSCVARLSEIDSLVLYTQGETFDDPRALSHPSVQQRLTRAVRYALGEDWSKKTVKVAAIGYGGAFNMRKLHLESCKRARLTPVAVCDVDEKRTAIGKQDFRDHIQT